MVAIKNIIVCAAVAVAMRSRPIASIAALFAALFVMMGTAQAQLIWDLNVTSGRFPPGTFGGTGRIIFSTSSGSEATRSTLDLRTLQGSLNMGPIGSIGTTSHVG